MPFHLLLSVLGSRLIDSNLCVYRGRAWSQSHSPAPERGALGLLALSGLSGFCSSSPYGVSPVGMEVLLPRAVGWLCLLHPRRRAAPPPALGGPFLLGLPFSNKLGGLFVLDITTKNTCVPLICIVCLLVVFFFSGLVIACFYKARFSDRIVVTMIA